MTTILIKKKDTAGAPAAGDLTNAAGGTEIAVNTATRRIYTKDAGGTVVELSTNASSSTIADLTVTNSTTLSYGTANQVQFLNASKLLVGSGNMTFNGTRLTVADLADSGLTSGRVTYASTGGALVDSANLTFDGTNLTLGGGTANGVAYLNGSKVLTSGSALTFDGSQLDIPAGSAASPSLSTPADVNTGLYFPAADTIGLSTNGTERVRLDPSGNLGIGTSSPQAYLHIQATSGLTPQIRLGQTSAYQLQLGYNNSAEYGFLQAYAANLSTPDDIVLNPSGGNVGIGTSSPNARLAVVGGGIRVNGYSSNSAGDGVNVQIGTTGGVNYLQSLNGTGTNNLSIDANQITFRTGAYNTAATLDSSGNLGLGVTPSSWSGLGVAFETLGGALAGEGTNNISLYQNVYYQSSAYRYKTTGNAASIYSQSNGSHRWFTAPSGTAGNAISFTQAMTLNASGNLGVGTSSPNGKLDVAAGNVFITQDYELNWHTSGTKRSQIIGDSSNNLKFSNRVSGVLINTMTLDGTGNLGLGVTPSAWGTGSSVLEVGKPSVTSVTSAFSSGAALQLAYNGYFNGTNWIYKGSYFATRYSSDVGQHQWFTAPSGTAGNAISFTQALTLNTNGALVLQGGDTAAAGVGITFPATQSASSNANTLDDYEEGTWTPVLTIGFTVVGATTLTGTYTKIGNTVFVRGTLQAATSLTSAGGNTRVTGFPFTSTADCAVVFARDDLNYPGTGFFNGTGAGLYNPAYSAGSSTVIFTFSYTV